MSVLFWAFLAGGLAVGFPLLFHLIRRTPKGQQAFSSLMFLRPSPPRLTRRSRLDDIVLLLLRALAILLLAAAFMRPFLRSAADLSLDNVRGRRVAVLLDTSASMRRGDLWRQAIGRAEKVLDRLSPADDVALFTYDEQLSAVVGFEENTLAIARAEKPSLVKSQLGELSPTWNATHLGEALVRVAELLDEARGADESDAARQIIVISDLQAGSQIEALQVFEWPERIRVAVQQVSLDDNTNASVQLLAATDDDPSHDPRVRVTNEPDSGVDQFQVHWAGEAENPGEKSVAFYVPPGQSRVLRVPRSKSDLAATRLVVSGDPASFDNTQYVVPVRQQLVRLAYLGSDEPNDPEAMRFYLERAFGETPRRKLQLTSYLADAALTLLPGELPQMIVITHAPSAAQAESVKKYVARGGSALVVLNREALDGQLSLLSEAVLDDATFPADENDYRMLGEIDFTHPLFATFANPRYNDFTDIRFWDYVPIRLGGGTAEHTAAVQVIARFDNGKPAIWQQTSGSGTLYVMAAGWQPRESQLALSNKFVPLMEELLMLSAPRKLSATTYEVGDAVPLPETAAGAEPVVIGPAKNELNVAASAGSFRATHEPGVYQLQFGGESHAFAVNLARSESETAPLGTDRLEQLGVKLGLQATQAEEFEQLRQRRDEELEQHQKLWKWLIVAALVVLALETGIAGRRARQIAAESGEST